MSKPRPSYNFCGICGHTPRSNTAPNWGPIRWWDPDDGYKVGTLCPGCREEFEHVKPKPTDLASAHTNGVADQVDTDEDILDVINDIEPSSFQQSAAGASSPGKPPVGSVLRDLVRRHGG